MNTGNFNLIDRVLARLRLAKITGYLGKDEVVLDFGCGQQGYFLKTMAGRIKKGVGIDYDAPNAEFDNIRMMKFEFNDNLPFKDKSFTKIIMLAVLEHIKPDLVVDLFKEFRRLLSAGGEIILTTPTPLGKPVMELLAGLGVINKAEIKDHKKYYNRADLEKLAEKSELRLVSYQFFQIGLNSVAVFKKNK